MNIHLQPPTRPKFPLSSPVADDHDSTYSSRSGHTHLSHNPFATPNTNQAAFTDDASSDTSGQDEFHLERYSQALDRKERERQHAEQSQEQSLTTKPRPGLNIITNFSDPGERPTSDGTVIDQVHMQRRRLGSPAATSILSQKAAGEVSRPSNESLPTLGFISLKDLAKMTNKDMIVKTKLKSALKSKRSLSSLHSQDMGSTTDKTLKESDEGRILANDRSIVIGISVPKDQVEKHKPKDGSNSALTMQSPSPATPAIIITPAEASFPSDRGLPTRSRPRARRPASSIYSQVFFPDRKSRIQADVPPMPNRSDRDGFILGPERPPYPTDSIPDLFHKRPNSTDTIFDDENVEGESPELDMHSERRSFSSESRHQILPEDLDSARPKSKGWWNLMLSPVLSRAGTLRSIKMTPEEKIMPPIPKYTPTQDVQSGYFDYIPNKSQLQNFDDPRASKWSDWIVGDEADSTHTRAGVRIEEDRVHNPSATLPFAVGIIPAGKGSAREYYHACAVDSMSSEPYFECENHSCKDSLPKLRSCHENGVQVASHELKEPAARSLGQAEALTEEHTAPVTEEVPTENLRPVIHREPTQFSPNIRQADFTPIIKAAPRETAIAVSPPVGAKELVEPEKSKNMSALPSKPIKMPAYSPPRPKMTKFLTLDGAGIEDNQPPIASPGPVSPAMQRTMTSQGAIPMSEAKITQPAPIFINNHTTYPEPSLQARNEPVTFADLERPLAVRNRSEMRQRSLEKIEEKAPEKKKKAGCVNLDCFRRGGSKGMKWRRWHLLIFLLLLAIIIACILLATQLTRKGTHTPVQSQWLNLTGFPPMPTGISTVARPDPAVTAQGCIGLTTMWSCAVPKEDQAAIVPNDPDQPNFRFEITFRNGTVPANETLLVATKRSTFIERHAFLARQNDPFTNSLFTPNPAPPSATDQIFLGNTTDNITAPFNGEITPFFITFISTSPVLPPAFNSTTTAVLTTRQASNLSSIIPPPSLAPDGTAAAANLLPTLPFPYSQPIRLYNRGLPSEHYGFYTYYDRSIFLHSTAALNGSNTEADNGVVPEDQDGGSTKSEAVVRCTWAQTRFLVKIWTSGNFGAVLLSGASNSTSNKNDNNKANSSATDFSVPGSFPYPVSIVVDRHGGDLNKKSVFCYGMNDQQQIEVDVKTLEAENRGAGGTIVNQAPGLIQNGNGTDGNGDGFNATAGGIDGGTGGCACEWRNWIGSN